MKCYIVAVNYSDILQHTLPYNRHHFDELIVVTDPADFPTVSIATENNCIVHATEEFYRGGAYFNKWSALEEALNHYGTSGEMCIMDADIMLPKDVQLPCQSGKLIIPERHMTPLGNPPQEKDWENLPLDEFRGWAGYCMLFHGGDPVLLKRPWFPGWIHAGGGDTDFERRWRKPDKLRPSFRVLHIGEPRTNWCGRTEADKKRLQHIMDERRFGGLSSERM